MTRRAYEPPLPSPFWRLWWATGVNAIGSGAFAAAAPLLAVSITRDPWAVSFVSAATYLPWLMLSLPAGALIDRRDRVALMRNSQILQAATVGVLTFLAASDLVGVITLALAAFGLGACQVVFTNSAQTILPDVVGSTLLHKANGYQQVALTTGQLFVGPPVGSLLFAVTVTLPFGTQAVAFVLAATLIAILGNSGGTLIEHPPVRTAIAEGIRWLAGHRLLRTLVVLLGVNTFCGQLGNATLVLLATQTLHLDTRAYGLLLAAAAIGSVVGGLLNARLVRRIGALAALLSALVANIAVFVGIGLSPNALVLGALLAANGFVTTAWNIVTVTLRQQIVPARLLGRVNSVYKMLGWGLMPLGALAGGFVADAFGLRAPYPIAGVLRGLVLLVTVPTLTRAMRD